MADRKVYATVKGTINIPVMCEKEVIVRVDEGGDVDAAIRAAANGETGGDDWDLVDDGEPEIIEDMDTIDATLSCVDTDIANCTSVDITDSK